MMRQGNERISEKDLRDKITQMPRLAGCTVIRYAITLYVLLSRSDVPTWAKVSIVATLAYFICPIDTIPDFLPGGYIDDLAAMTLLINQLDVFKDEETQEEVERLLPGYCRKEDIDLLN